MASAFDGPQPFFGIAADAPPASTSLTAAGQSATWNGTLNGFIALSDDPSRTDVNDIWTFSIASGLVGRLTIAGRSVPALGLTSTDRFLFSLTGPVEATGGRGGSLDGLTAGDYTAAFINQTAFPNFAAYTMTVSAAPVPEPAGSALMGAGLLGLAAWSRRTRRPQT